MPARKRSIALALAAVAGMVLVGCASPTPRVVEKVITQVVTQQVRVVETQVVEKPVEKIVEKRVTAEPYTTPHATLGDLRVRQAIAYCVDRDAIIAAAYPYVTDRAALRMDAGVPKSHWAWSGPYQDYAHDPARAKALLEDAGWHQVSGADYRTNDKGEVLAIKLTTTNTSFRQTWTAVVEQNLKDCGIQLVRQLVPSTWLFGASTGLQRRDFELAAYAWIGQTDPQGQTLYTCDQVPLPGNNWHGQNVMGWCDQQASDAIAMATNSLSRADRKKAYDIVWKAMAQDMVSLPMFQRAEVEAWSTGLAGVRTDPTEYATATAETWKLKDVQAGLVIGLAEEPASLWSLVDSSSASAQIGQMGIGIGNTQYGYDYQPVLQDGLSTIESGKARNDTVEVKAGDTVYTAARTPARLEKGTRVLVDGVPVAYDGSSPLKLRQLVVDYQLKPYTWSDGVAGSEDDIKLAYKINCDRTSGATTFAICDEIQKVDYGQDLGWTVTYYPGVQDPSYMVMPWSTRPNNPVYPSHQVLQDGRKLADVPAAEWHTLPEIAEKPLSYGPWMITEWVKGRHIGMTANPAYKPAPGIKDVTILFVPDADQAVAQVASGEVDYLERAIFADGAGAQTLAGAAQQGKVHMEIVPGATWEHIDFNLFTR